MTQVCYPFVGDATSDAEFSVLARNWSDNGVVPDSSGGISNSLQVVASSYSSGLYPKVSVLEGRAVIRGFMFTVQGETETVTVLPQSSGSRLDLVVIRVIQSVDSEREIRGELAVLKGTSATIPPTPNQTDLGIFEFPLSEISVSSSGVSIGTDVRVLTTKWRDDTTKRIADEEDRAMEAESGLNTAIGAEKDRAIGAEGTKVDKVSGKSLVLDTEITKLVGVKENAEPNKLETINGKSADDKKNINIKWSDVMVPQIVTATRQLKSSHTNNFTLDIDASLDESGNYNWKYKGQWDGDYPRTTGIVVATWHGSNYNNVSLQVVNSSGEGGGPGKVLVCNPDHSDLTNGTIHVVMFKW